MQRRQFMGSDAGGSLRPKRLRSGRRSRHKRVWIVAALSLVSAGLLLGWRIACERVSPPPSVQVGEAAQAEQMLGSPVSAPFARDTLARVERSAVLPAAQPSSPMRGGIPLPSRAMTLAEIHGFFRLAIEEQIDALGLSAEAIDYVATPNGRRMAAGLVADARKRFSDLNRERVRANSAAFQSLDPREMRRALKPGEDASAYTSVWCSSGGNFYMSRDQAPAVFVIQGAMMQVPAELKKSIEREAMSRTNAR